MAASLLSLLPAYAVVRTAMIYSLTPGRPDVAARLDSGHPRVIAGRVAATLQPNNLMADEATQAAARKALNRAPMLVEPLMLAGIDALAKDEDGKAKQAFAEVLRRDPRAELGRLLMLEVDLRTSDVRRAVSDMTILGRLVPGAGSLFVPELARFARDPRTSRALGPVLRSDPTMLANVLRYLAENGATTDLVLELAGGTSTAAPGRDVGDWREPLLRAMVERGDFVRARQLWAAFAGMRGGPPADAVYDARFRGLPGLPPFNWALLASEIGAAEPDRSGGLEVEYYGRAPGELATQLVVLAPGHYRLMFRAEGDIHDPQHRLFWTLQCSGKDGAKLATFPIADLTYAGRTFAGDFAVPAGCAAVWLKLVGEPAEFPKIESVVIREVAIRRQGAQA